MRPNKEILRSTCTSVLDSLMIVEVLEPHPLSSNCVNSTSCSLSFSFIGRTSLLQFLQPYFLVTMWPMVAQSQRFCWTLNLWVPPDFRLFSIFEDENGQLKFSCIFILILGKSSRAQKNITLQFALYVTTGSSVFF